ncbi:ABC transporter I member 19 [Asimina triloba]
MEIVMTRWQSTNHPSHTHARSSSSHAVAHLASDSLISLTRRSSCWCDARSVNGRERTNESAPQSNFSWSSRPWAYGEVTLKVLSRSNSPFSGTKMKSDVDSEMSGNNNGIQVSALHFTYNAHAPLFVNFNLDISPGSRCLLVGANGSGKTTLLKILAGKHMVGGSDVVRVLNGSAFHDTHLVCSGDLSYLGGSWSKTIGSAGEVPLQGDFSAEHMIFGVAGVDPVRREKLIDLLDIDLQWRMHKVSDGQRRRVQICMGLLHPFKVLLLDEVTVDLDVVARLDLLDFFKEECDQRGATIVYATHIFDGLETWATHVAYIQDGELRRSEKLSKLNELKNATNLLSVVESWLRAEIKSQKKKPIASPLQLRGTSPLDTSPFGSSRHMAYYR